MGILVATGEALAGRPAFHLATLLFLPLVLSAIRGAIRLAGVAEALPGSRQQIMAHAWIYIVLPVFVPFLYLVNFFNSLFTRKIRWRGVVYELVSSGQTRIISY
jgi:hypothetical protein